MDYTIKTASINDIQFIISMAEKEGWLPGLLDGTSFYQADPTGFYVGFLDDKPISCISAVKYPSSAFIGLYIVKIIEGKAMAIKYGNMLLIR